MSELTKEQWKKINDFNDDKNNDDDVVVECMKKIIERHENGILSIRACLVLDELYYAFFERLLKVHETAGADYKQVTYDPCKDDREEQKQELIDYA